MATLACPSCGRGNTEHTCLAEPEARPSPGDWTICVFCSAVCEFGPEPLLLPRLVTQAELDAAPADIKALVSDHVRALDDAKRSLASGRTV